jgi:hemolysin III
MALSKDGSVHVTDEKFNAISHLFAAILFTLLGVILIVRSSVRVEVWEIVSLAIYAVSAILLFIASTLHHGLNLSQKANEILRTIDYCSVFILIAGTITPLALIFVRNWLSWTIFGTIWGIAIIGIVLRSLFLLPKWVTNTFYITLGWLTVAIVLPLFGQISLFGIGLLALGGLFYTVGFTIYVVEKPNFVTGVFGFHELWHVLVILGALFHWLFFFLFV